MVQYNFPDDLLDYIRGLEDRIKLLEKLSRAGNTSIDNGALEVRQNGATKTKIGLLDDGSFGISMYNDAGQPLNVSQLAFGLGGVAVDAGTTPVLNQWVDDPSLSLPVTIKNGRAIVIVSAKLSAGDGGTGTPADAWYSYRATGPTTITEDFGRGLYTRYDGFGMVRVLQASWVDLRTGLSNGSYTFIPRMYAGSVGSPSNGSSFAYRRLIVLPY
ncbi:MAG TPA: hypothetical protein VM715_21370 [Candidatus Acidoferrum sp.]|nr:hypothetical protein [Candidatus Acidoferrum sp.]